MQKTIGKLSDFFTPKYQTMLESGSLFFVLAIGIANLVIFFLIIQAATKAKQRAKYEWAQMELLKRMAKLQGVPEADIETIMTVVNAKD